MATVRKIKIEDSDELRSTLDNLYENATQIVLAKWALDLVKHIFMTAGYNVNDYDAVINGFLVNEAWQNGQARMHDVRQAGFKIHKLAKNSDDKLLMTALRVAGQAVGTGHMREHAMVTSDYAIKLINLIYPGNQDAVKQERLWQIRTMELHVQRSKENENEQNLKVIKPFAKEDR
ncbi:hypothetical protein KII95_01890 [Leuconostoc gelidum subsp. aenigmaticum]|uniref:putative immunity protein n=1 Tax=Leuconostoc gelidum TaxID=1244 RepID=UPI001CC7C927|nr:hypothetical protein [Leuconostoc gelidum]MBZ6002794.1 hypothetical protein [Leuconostoc gelidum subsp. aenigmaticum]